MAVLQMQKLCICALKKDRKSLMEFLQAAGVLELTAENRSLEEVFLALTGETADVPEEPETEPKGE